MHALTNACHHICLPLRMHAFTYAAMHGIKNACSPNTGTCPNKCKFAQKYFLHAKLNLQEPHCNEKKNVIQRKIFEHYI